MTAFLKRLFEILAKIQTAIGRFFTSLPFWKEVEKIAMIVAGPVRKVSALALRWFPFLRRFEKYLETEALTKRPPVILAITIIFLAYRGLKQSENGHIGTDAAVFPFLAIVSGFNPFLGLISGICFGAADLVQKLIRPDIFGASHFGDANYYGAMVGYVVAYSATIWMGLFPGLLSRIGRNAAIGLFQKIRGSRAAASADGATPPAPDSLTDAVGLLGSIVGGVAGGYTSLRNVAPVLEKPAFYWRPTPDISCYHSEVQTLVDSAPTSAAAGGVGGAIAATNPPVQPPPKTPPSSGDAPPKGGGGPTQPPIQPQDPEDGWVVEMPDGSEKTFASEDEANKFIEQLDTEEDKLLKQDDYKLVMDRIEQQKAFIEGMKAHGEAAGVKNAGDALDQSQAELNALLNQKQQLEADLKGMGGAIPDYQGKPVAAWQADWSQVAQDQLHQQQDQQLAKIQKMTNGVINLQGKGSLSPEATTKLLKKLNEIQDKLAGEGELADPATVGKVKDLIRDGVAASVAKAQAEQFNWVEEGSLSTIREAVTGVTADGKTSFSAMALQGLTGILTGGQSAYAWEVADKMYIINDEIQDGRTGMQALNTAVGRVFIDEGMGRIVEGGMAVGGKLLKGGYKKLAGGVPIEDAVSKTSKNTGDLVRPDVDAKLGRVSPTDVPPTKVPSIKQLDNKIGKMENGISTGTGKPKAKLEDVLDLQKNPQGVRRVKEYGSPKTKEAFNNTLRDEVYTPHDLELQDSLNWPPKKAASTGPPGSDLDINTTPPSKGQLDRINKIKKLEAEIKKKHPDATLEVKTEVDDFRTPGKDYAPDDINTDRDFRVLEEYTIRDGDGNVIESKSVWGTDVDGNDLSPSAFTQKNEVPKEIWEGKHHEVFASKTGFDTAKCPPEIQAKSLAEQQEWWAAKHGQAGTDKFHIEASRDYTDHIYDPKTGVTTKVDLDNSNIAKLKSISEGKSPVPSPGGAPVTLDDPGGIGTMYKAKVDLELSKGNPYEAIAQARKGVSSLDASRNAYLKQGFEVGELPGKMEEAMKLVGESDLHINPDPKNLTALNQQLQKLGFKDLSNFTDKMSGQFESLKFAK